MVDPTTQISTPLAQLRAQAAAAKLADATAPVADPVPAQVVPVVAQQAPVAAPVLLDEDSIPDLSAVIAAPAPPAKSPVATPACASRSISSLCSFVSVAQLKFGLAVAIVFFAVSMMPVDALVRKFSFLGKLPFANTLLKALTAGVAVTVMTPCIQDAR